jgi:peptidylprolyl isomerase
VRRTALALLPVLLAGALTSCSGGGSGLPEASGGFGDKPKVTVSKDARAPKTLKTEVLVEGDGPTVKKGDLLVADYLGKNFRSGKVFDNSYDRKVPAAFPIGTGSVIPGWDKALVGVKAGSRVEMVIPPKDGYGKQGNAQAGIKGTDALVFVVDVIASYPKEGVETKNTPVPDVPNGLPKVSGTPGSEPTISIAKGTPPPSQPEVHLLDKGTGPKVTRGELAVLEYSAVDWSGKALASSWQQGPQGVPIGGAQASPFDLLTGVPAGSRVLMMLPAQTGADASKDSVAVVVDLLGLHGPATSSSKESK